MSSSVPVSHRRSAAYRAEVDGLRAVAILLVVGYHVGLPGFAGGFVGVDIFFAISGYLITRLLFRELGQTGRVDWGAFYARRIRRLLPAALVLIAFLLAAAPFLLNPIGEQQGLAKSAIASLALASNLYFWQVEPIGYFTAPQGGSFALLHTWSLSLEEQFYLAVPLVLIASAVLGRLAPWGRRTCLIVVAALLTATSLCLAIWSSTHYPTAGFYSPVTRAYEFGLGGLVALAADRRQPGDRWARVLALVGAAFVAYSLARPASSDTFPSGWALVPVLGTCLVLLAGSPTRSPVTWGLSTPPLVTVGRLSYGWYLWHWPLLSLAVSVNLAPVEMWVRLLLVVLALLIAGLSDRLVERRFRTPPWVSRKALPARTRGTYLVGAAAASVCLLAAGSVGFAAQQERGSTQWHAVSTQVADLQRLPAECEQPGVDGAGPSERRCELNAFDEGRPTVLLWGDSHAWHWLPALETAAQQADVNLVSWTLGGCPPLLPEDYEARLRGVSDPTRAETLAACIRHDELAMADVLALAGDSGVRVVLAARWEIYLGQDPITLADRPIISEQHEDSSRFYRGYGPRLGDLSASLSSSGVAIDLVGPVPELVRPAPQCLSSRWWSQHCDIAAGVVADYQRDAWTWLAEALEAATPDSSLIDVRGSLCDAQVCRAENDGTVNYWDDDHLSATRSRSLWEAFLPTVQRAQATGSS